MEREECLAIAKDKGWDYLVMNFAHKIEEDFWEEFISEVKLKWLLPMRRFSDEFMENFRDLMGEKLYKKYMAIYYLLDISEEDNRIFSDLVLTFLQNIRKKEEINYLVDEYSKNNKVYEDTAVSILMEYVREHYDLIGNSSLSNDLLEKIAISYLKIQMYVKDYGITEPADFKKFLNKMKKKDELFRAEVMTSVYDDIPEYTNMVVVVLLDVIQGIGSIEMSFVVEQSRQFSFSI